MASSKTFDMSISLKSRTDSASDYSFTGLAKDDAGPIKSYLQERKVRVKDTTEEEAVLLADDLSDEEEDSGDDSDAGGKLAHRKKNGKDIASGSKAKAAAASGGGGDEDDDESGKLRSRLTTRVVGLEYKLTVFPCLDPSPAYRFLSCVTRGRGFPSLGIRRRIRYLIIRRRLGRRCLDGCSSQKGQRRR